MAKRRIENELRKRLKGLECVYCGEAASTGDHFPPATVTAFGVILPSCNECNLLAGTEWSFDLWERCNFVKGRLRRRYRKVLNWEDFEDDKLLEVDAALVGMVMQWRELKKRTEKRIAWNVGAYIASIDHSNCIARMLADKNIFKAGDDLSWENLDDEYLKNKPRATLAKREEISEP